MEADRTSAIAVFREERLKEPVEAYTDQFEIARDAFDELLETTVDFTLLAQNAMDVLAEAKFLEAVRYVASPPISEDDLKTLAETDSLAKTAIKADPAVAQRIIATVMEGLDRRRFPWVSEGREANEIERASAVLASAALLANQRVSTSRRNDAKTAQETDVCEMLKAAGFAQVATRPVSVLSSAPKPGEFCKECQLGDRKADILLGLWDGRTMPVECKVSNSATNSIKRLNNDAAVKAVYWRKTFGESQVVPTAVLSGVFKLNNLKQAQAAGLSLFWGQDLATMSQWIEVTRPAKKKR